MAAIARPSLFLLFLLLESPLLIIADPPSSGDSSYNTTEPATEVSPGVAIFLIVFISAFFLSGFVFVVFRKIIGSWCCGIRSGRDSPPVGGDGGTGPRRVPGGLTRQSLQTIPVYFYKDVKMHRQVSKGELECAVCLNKFGDNEELRVLPNCSHVLHPDCVDPWLLSQATCPVCRTVLNMGESCYRSGEPEASDNISAPPPAGHERSTLRLPEEARFERARSERRGFRGSIPWLGRGRLSQQNIKVDPSRFPGSICTPSVSHLV